MTESKRGLIELVRNRERKKVSEQQRDEHGGTLEGKSTANALRDVWPLILWVLKRYSSFWALLTIVRKKWTTAFSAPRLRGEVAEAFWVAGERAPRKDPWKGNERRGKEQRTYMFNVHSCSYKRYLGLNSWGRDTCSNSFSLIIFFFFIENITWKINSWSDKAGHNPVTTTVGKLKFKHLGIK